MGSGGLRGTGAGGAGGGSGGSGVLSPSTSIIPIAGIGGDDEDIFNAIGDEKEPKKSPQEQDDK
jgi:hypothetical protein